MKHQRPSSHFTRPTKFRERLRAAENRRSKFSAIDFTASGGIMLSKLGTKGVGNLAEYYIPAGEVVKLEPKSEGINTPRKKKPKELAVITECCTGCAGSPACVPYCPVEDCMYWVPDEEHPPFGRIEVDPYLCIGCKKCTSKGPNGAFLDGCPWDAIEMIPTEAA